MWGLQWSLLGVVEAREASGHQGPRAQLLWHYSHFPTLGNISLTPKWFIGLLPVGSQRPFMGCLKSQTKGLQGWFATLGKHH